jgi:uncharacterized ferritin-like protein (DUF455 family)
VQPKKEKDLSLMSQALKSFPWDDRYAYGMFLAQTYYYVCHSTKLLAVAAGRMKKEDHVFYKRFIAHMSEENGHEAIAIKDLKNLGFRIEEFPELPETRMFWETQYYKIEHNDPVSLIGYIYALEAVACNECPWIKKQLEKYHPANCHSFIRVHGEDDPAHVVKAKEQIDSLSEARLKFVEENFDQTVVSYAQLIRGIVERSKNGRLMKVA